MGRRFGEVGLRDSGEVLGDIECEGMGKGKFRRVRLAGFRELGKTGMGWIGMI